MCNVLYTDRGKKLDRTVRKTGTIHEHDLNTSINCTRMFILNVGLFKNMKVLNICRYWRTFEILCQVKPLLFKLNKVQFTIQTLKGKSIIKKIYFFGK